MRTPAQARKFLHGAVRSRLDQIAAVGAALDTHDRAVDRREQAEQDLDVATTALGAATERLGTAVGLRDERSQRWPPTSRSGRPDASSSGSRIRRP